MGPAFFFSKLLRSFLAVASTEAIGYLLRGYENENCHKLPQLDSALVPNLHGRS